MAKKVFYDPEMGSSSGIESKTGRIRLLGIAAVLVGLSGCTSVGLGQSEYSCSGLPEGVRCMSARDVYAATNEGQIPRPNSVSTEAGSTNEGQISRPNFASTEAGWMTEITDTTETQARSSGRSEESATREQGDNVVETYVAPNLPNKPIPIRTPATVMRIWVAPWEDKNGDLNVTGYVYTEVEKRRWVIGEAGTAQSNTLKPLDSKP